MCGCTHLILGQEANFALSVPTGVCKAGQLAAQEALGSPLRAWHGCLLLRLCGLVQLQDIVHLGQMGQEQLGKDILHSFLELSCKL